MLKDLYVEGTKSCFSDLEQLKIFRTIPKNMCLRTISDKRMLQFWMIYVCQDSSKTHDIHVSKPLQIIHVFQENSRLHMWARKAIDDIFASVQLLVTCLNAFSSQKSFSTMDEQFPDLLV